MAQRTPTTKDIGLIYQLIQEGQVQLSPEFQRSSVWPRSAKAYLIDTILCDRPMPLFFLQRSRSAQNGRTTFNVVDGQQRLRAILEFIEDRFSLSESKSPLFRNKKYSALSKSLREKILNYDLSVQELSGYSEEDIRNIFVRMNRFVVKLSPQELRHARESGKFYEFVEELGSHPFFSSAATFTALQRNRMKAVEFAAELAILLIEGPQDKKSSVDLYYQEYRNSFPFASDVRVQLEAIFSWIGEALPALRRSRYRRPTDLYSLVGALAEIAEDGRRRSPPDARQAGKKLQEFEIQLGRRSRRGSDATEYLAASGRQTDNLAPREQRIRILKKIICGSR